MEKLDFGILGKVLRSRLVGLAMLMVTIASGAPALANVPYLVKDINPGPMGSGPTSKTKVGNRLFFNANDGVHGQELWVSDGTESGTYMVADIVTQQNNIGPLAITDVEGRAYFQTDNPTSGHDLYVSDGSVKGTSLVTNISDLAYYQNRAPLGNLLLFVKEDAQGVARLAKTDGTPEGTLFLGFVGVNQMLSTGSVVFFAGVGTDQQTIPGYDLWESDGTTNGTVKLRDLGGCIWLTESNGLVFFEGEDPQADNELWVSDGTPQGTRRVKDINPGPNPSSPSTLRDVNGTLFFIAYSPGFGRELWKSDGTELGTQMIIDLVPGPGNCGIYDMINVNGVAFFARFDSIDGWQLWKTDGTVDGTLLVKVIGPPSLSSDYRPDYFVSVNGKLYFSASDGQHGKELWVSNGTLDGTYMVDDTTPGPDSSWPFDLRGVGTRIFYVGGGNGLGGELWAYDTRDASIPASSIISVLCLALLLVLGGIVVLKRGTQQGIM